MAFKNDPISTVLDSVKAILTFSILFWSMSILFNSFRGPDPVRIRIRSEFRGLHLNKGIQPYLRGGGGFEKNHPHHPRVKGLKIKC
jgi:hypothetical protein